MERLLGISAGLVVTALLFCTATAEVIRGSVHDSRGESVAEARIAVEGSDVATTTDRDGRFTLAAQVLPARLQVVSSGHYPLEFVVSRVDRSLEITVVAIPRIEERITVTEHSASTWPVPTGAAMAAIRPDQTVMASGSVAELVSAIPEPHSTARAEGRRCLPSVGSPGTGS